jgi:hypothetical protein
MKSHTTKGIILMQEIASGLGEKEKLVRPEMMVVVVVMGVEDIQFECR